MPLHVAKGHYKDSMTWKYQKMEWEGHISTVLVKRKSPPAGAEKPLRPEGLEGGSAREVEARSSGHPGAGGAAPPGGRGSEPRMPPCAGKGLARLG